MVGVVGGVCIDESVSVGTLIRITEEVLSAMWPGSDVSEEYRSRRSTKLTKEFGFDLVFQGVNHGVIMLRESEERSGVNRIAKTLD